ncbi:hypothetical protein ASV33_14255 [Enterobacter hormaechei subsp. xiangfangensis]|nr:hypothetical protein ASV34_14290 [Enterobacter hormaechei subsp. xiangfangensis]MCM7562265.1 hypothetical protein [Enterobacter hormaechei]HAS1739244.1 hypothetical protein [Enterobacter hormaechei subsp. oharae]KTH00193.1 hypothetical protein ASV33_14255 [Enterobacter hormaechei subsp. xiangfangensis]KTH25288.1 hypothetical protein ASV30_20270 [Enterobacter hormaechei subsp. xiangfangensis]
MIQSQLTQVIFWLGLIAALPAFYRFVYAGSSLIWHKYFPVKKIEIQLVNEDKALIENIVLDLDKQDAKRVIELIESSRKKGKVR